MADRKFYPNKNGGGGDLAMLTGGGRTSFEIVLTWEINVLAMLKERRKKFLSF